MQIIVYEDQHTWVIEGFFDYGVINLRQSIAVFWKKTNLKEREMVQTQRTAGGGFVEEVSLRGSGCDDDFYLFQSTLSVFVMADLAHPGVMLSRFLPMAQAANPEGEFLADKRTGG